MTRWRISGKSGGNWPAARSSSAAGEAARICPQILREPMTGVPGLSNSSSHPDEGDGMADDPDICQQLRQPDSPAAGMAAAHEAFEEMLLAIWRYQDGGGPFFASFVMASAAAASGRDAIAWAPSLASAPRGTRKLPARQDQDSATHVAAWLAALSKAVADCLLFLVGQAVEAEDREACRNGALYADDLHHLVAGNEP